MVHGLEMKRTMKVNLKVVDGWLPQMVNRQV
jgi:hypothetical protein